MSAQPLSQATDYLSDPTAHGQPGQPVLASELDSELERKAAEARLSHAAGLSLWDRPIAQQKAQAVVFSDALRDSCSAHNAASGEPCWWVPPDNPRSQGAKAVCGLRVRRAIDRLRREWEQAQAEREAKAERQRSLRIRVRSRPASGRPS
jgi:hypothetical protein